MNIRDHHQRAIDRLADCYQDDPRFLGLIIGGSVAKGYAGLTPESTRLASTSHDLGLVVPSLRT